MFLAHKAIEIHHQQTDILKDFFAIANARFRAGKGTQVDVLKSAVELSKLENELPVLEQQRETAKAKLNLLLSRARSLRSESPLAKRARRARETTRRSKNSSNWQSRAAPSCEPWT